MRHFCKRSTCAFACRQSPPLVCIYPLDAEDSQDLYTCHANWPTAKKSPIEKPKVAIVSRLQQRLAAGLRQMHHYRAEEVVKLLSLCNRLARLRLCLPRPGGSDASTPVGSCDYCRIFIGALLISVTRFKILWFAIL